MQKIGATGEGKYAVATPDGKSRKKKKLNVLCYPMCLVTMGMHFQSRDNTRRLLNGVLVIKTCVTLPGSEHLKTFCITRRFMD